MTRKGRGNIPAGKVQRAFYLPTELADTLRIEAAKRNESQSSIVEKALRRELGMAALTWQVIEDNAGGLHLAVLEDGRCIYYGHGYEHNEDGLRADLDALRRGDDPRTDGWEYPDGIVDPQAAYDDLTSHEHGWQIVADHDGIYYDRMGSAAERVFMVRWDELQLFDRDNDPVTDQEQIRAALVEFRETGAMDGYFFERLNLPHEDPEDASTWGPESPERVNWDGFDG